MALDFVVHAPIPYSRHSAGFRALYKLAYELQQRGKSVAISPLRKSLLGLPGYVPSESPYTFRNADDLHYDLVANAVHVLPEIVDIQPPEGSKLVRWLLNYQIHPFGPDDLVVAWKKELDPDVPRLTVDVIERFFYPKTHPGLGTLYYTGKGHDTPIAIDGEGIKRIDHQWPATRTDLANELRAANLLISSDSYTMLNIEATICGTPVLLTPGCKPPSESVWGTIGIATNEDELPVARVTVPMAALHYEEARQKIKHDVDNLIELCDAHFQ